MTLAIIINVALSAIALAAIIGPHTWAIISSRDGQAVTPATAGTLRSRSVARRQSTLAQLQPHA